MKHSAKMLAVILVLVSLCSCKLPFTSAGPFTSGGTKWVNEQVPLSGDMVNCIKTMFAALPSGKLLLTTQKIQNLKGGVVFDLVLLDPDTKKETNLTEELHKINNSAVCTFNGDGTKLIMMFNEKSYGDKGILERGITGLLGLLGDQWNYSAVFNKNGDVLISSKSQLAYTDDLSYVARTNMSKDNCYINTDTKEKIGVAKDTSIKGIQSDYIYGQTKFGDIKDVSSSSKNAVQPIIYSQWFYNCKTKKLVEDKTMGNSITIMSIKNDHVLYSVVGQNNAAYDYDLNTKKSTVMTDRNTFYSSMDSVSPDGTYSVSDPMFAGERSLPLGVHIKNTKTNTTLDYPSDRGNTYCLPRWVEKK